MARTHAYVRVSRRKFTGLRLEVAVPVTQSMRVCFEKTLEFMDYASVENWKPQDPRFISSDALQLCDRQTDGHAACSSIVLLRQQKSSSHVEQSKIITRL